jgi:hypothetical protein
MRIAIAIDIVRAVLSIAHKDDSKQSRNESIDYCAPDRSTCPGKSPEC